MTHSIPTAPGPISAQALFDELIGLSQKLNESSDDLNAIIRAFEARLKELNLGVVARTRGFLVEENQSSVEAVLAYGPCNGKWQLCVYWEAVGQSVPDSDPKPLVELARDIRIEAIGLFPKLLENLKAEAEKTLRSIEDAKKKYGVKARGGK